MIERFFRIGIILYFSFITLVSAWAFFEAIWDNPSDYPFGAEHLSVTGGVNEFKFKSWEHYIATNVVYFFYSLSVAVFGILKKRKVFYVLVFLFLLTNAIFLFVY